MRVITIGRDENNDVIVDDPKVSRHHIQVVQTDDGQFRLADFGSTNGTYVNGQRISGEISLSEDDIIRIGNTLVPWKQYFDDTPEETDNDHNSSSEKAPHNVTITETEGKNSKKQPKGFLTFWRKQRKTKE